MPTQENKVFLDITLCNEAVSTASNIVETNIFDLQVTKKSNCPYAVVGGKICYTVTIVNNSDVDFIIGEYEAGCIIFRDPLANNLEYIGGSFEYVIGSGEPVKVEPDIDSNNVLTYNCLEIPAGKTAIVTFCVKVKSVPMP
jgi:uncharacterized repeat protein (TIGR01451 family)